MSQLKHVKKSVAILFCVGVYIHIWVGAEKILAQQISTYIFIYITEKIKVD